MTITVEFDSPTFNEDFLTAYNAVATPTIKASVATDASSDSMEFFALTATEVLMQYDLLTEDNEGEPTAYIIG